MKTKYKIKVLQKDIDNGFSCSGDNCPITLVVQRKFSKATKIFIRNKSGLFQWRGKEKNFKLPVRAQKFIIQFDDSPEMFRNSFKPFEFNIVLK